MNLEMLIKPFSKKRLLIQNKMPCHLLRVNIFSLKKKKGSTKNSESLKNVSHINGRYEVLLETVTGKLSVR